MSDYNLAPKSIVDELAQFIRKVDGNNRMGAGALADKICERFHVAAPAMQGEPVAYLFNDEAGRTKIVLGKETAELWCPPDESITPLYTAPQPAEQQPAEAQTMPDWDAAPPGATHYQPHQDAYYKRVSASEWYVWSRKDDREPMRWRPSLGTGDNAEWFVRPAEAQPGWYCVHCQRGVDAREVTYSEQHEVCGRYIANDDPPPPSAPVGVDDGINVPAAKALIKIVGPGFKVIYRDAFRWKDASGDVLPNHYETFSAETLARDFGYDLVLDLGYAAILRDPSDLSQQPTEHRPCPEDIREGAPYDDPAFEALCREHEIWGTAAAAQCAVFWEAGKRVAEQQPAPDVEGLEEAPITVIYTDGCGAGRRSPADCRDGVGYITVADTVYWPLSADDAQRLRSAECGRGDFTGPANECPDVSALVEELVEALDLARIDLKEWLKSFPNASREPTGKIIERIDAALAAYRKQGDKT